MALYLSPTQSQIQISLVAFLGSILPSLTEVYLMQDILVSEPSADNFVVLNPVRRPRFATNIDTFTDLVATGSIAGAVIHIETVSGGLLVAGLPILGAGVAAGTILGTQISGPIGGVGDWSVSPEQNLPTLQVFTLGTTQMLQKTDLVMQADVHGTLSSDNVQTISTMFRDPYAADFFVQQGYDVAPLYADEPRQVPFINAEQNYETRWSVDLHLEANQTVYNVPQQFASSLTLDLISVDATYPD